MESGDSKEIWLSKPDPNMEFQHPGIVPLTEDKWLVEKFTTPTSGRQYWIYSSDGNMLTGLPLGYDIANGGDPPMSYDLLSPDGVWVVIYFGEKVSDNQFEKVYYLLNTQTLEIKELPNLFWKNRVSDGVTEGFNIREYFWIEMP